MKLYSVLLKSKSTWFAKLLDSSAANAANAANNFTITDHNVHIDLLKQFPHTHLKECGANNPGQGLHA
jgi:hypothetical protein